MRAGEAGEADTLWCESGVARTIAQIPFAVGLHIRITQAGRAEWLVWATLGTRVVP